MNCIEVIHISSSFRDNFSVWNNIKPGYLNKLVRNVAIFARCTGNTLHKILTSRRLGRNRERGLKDGDIYRRCYIFSLALFPFTSSLQGSNILTQFILHNSIIFNNCWTNYNMYLYLYLLCFLSLFAILFFWIILYLHVDILCILCLSGFFVILFTYLCISCVFKNELFSYKWTGKNENGQIIGNF